VDSLNQVRPECFFDPEALIAAIAEREDRPAFAQLFGHYAPRIKAYLTRAGCEPVLAEELSQEVMLTIWRKAHLFDPALASANTWVFTIARNARIDAARRERTRSRVLNAPDPQVFDDSDALLWQAAMKMRLPTALAELPSDQAQALRSAFVDGLSHTEIAAKYALPVGTVKARVRRALLALRRALGPAR
jgi:RNA polymerase sigma-70 factor (ECF subfamily)